MYSWRGWFEGESDCEPPEPGKYWIEIIDEDLNEICVIVYRTKEFDQADPRVILREMRAQHIVDALNSYVGEWA